MSIHALRGAEIVKLYMGDPIKITSASCNSRMSWSDNFLRSLKENDVRLVTYVPDNVLTPDA